MEVNMNDYIELFKILTDETRVRILKLLQKQELCVCELVEITSLSQPKISKHIAKIRQSKLVNTEKNEQFIYYSLNQSHPQYSLLVLVLNQVEDNNNTESDFQTLNTITTFVCER